ncbi:RlpA-like double-psi beta-barrel-protein domain-containing protein-containing protein [Pilaira anomala]|nr:RlpA-like double-psi beta-barrel-protein domain-containing protein-containing protein [Pilaira anomala]
MKCQLFICLVVLLITIVNAKPVAVDRRGLIKDTVHKTIKTIKKLLFHGKATFFNPEKEGGAQGACGPWADVNSQIVALNGDQYGDMSQKSEWCGKKVKICYEDKCTIATVTDACPTCDHGCLDLTPAVWGQLESDYNKGIIPISWAEYYGLDEGDEDDEST